MKKCFTINCMRTHEDFLSYDKLIKENIFQAVELFYPYNVNDEQKELYTKEVSKLVNENNIEVVLHLPFGHGNDLVIQKDNNLILNDEVIKRINDAIDYAHQFKAQKLTLHLGTAFKNVGREELLAKVLEALKIFCSHASQYNMFVMIENMPRDNELGYSPDEIISLINESKCNNLKFILDTGHAHVSDYEITEYIHYLKDYLYHIHFSDNDGSCDQHRPIHQGNIDFKKVFTALNEINYSHLHCLEIIFKDSNDLLNYAKTIEEFNYLYTK